VFTSSYDLSCRVLDVGAGRSEEVVLGDAMFTGIELGDSARVVYASTYDGRVLRADVREAGPAHATEFALHERKIGGLALHPNGVWLATAGYDKKVCLWDVRAWSGGKAKGKPGKELASVEHGNGVINCSFSPNGAKLVSTCNDDKLRIIPLRTVGAAAEGAAKGSASFAPDSALTVIPHNNHTGQWLSNFRTIWDPHSAPGGDAHVVIGALGSRALEFYNADSGKRVLAATNDELLTAVPVINAIHPTRPLVASGTASGRLHLWTTRDAERFE
jgi:WD40 repeat protein